MDTHLVRLPPTVALSSTWRRDGAARRDTCGARREEALFPAPAGLEKEAVVGVKGSGFTVVLDLPLSVLEPVMELKRELSSGRDIVTTCEQQSSNPRVGTKRTAGGSMGDCHSTEGLRVLRPAASRHEGIRSFPVILVAVASGVSRRCRRCRRRRSAFLRWGGATMM